MADKFYAWSRILYGSKLGDKGEKLSDLAIEPGEEVTQAKLDVGDDDWAELVAGGAVRDYPFPESLQDPAASPNQLIAQGLADSETVASTVGVSPELVEAYGKQQKELAKAPKANTEVAK